MNIWKGREITRHLGPDGRWFDKKASHDLKRGKKPESHRRSNRSFFQARPWKKYKHKASYDAVRWVHWYSHQQHVECLKEVMGNRRVCQ